MTDPNDSALSASAEPVETLRRDVPTTHEERFTETIAILCGGARPPVEMVASWLDETADDLSLQNFCGTHGPWWAQGMAVLDAAHAMAESPCEGEGHLYAHAPAVQAEPPASVPDWRQAFIENRKARYIELGMKIEQAGINAETDAEMVEIYANTPPTTPEPK